MISANSRTPWRAKTAVDNPASTDGPSHGIRPAAAPEQDQVHAGLAARPSPRPHSPIRSIDVQAWERRHRPDTPPRDCRTPRVRQHYTLHLARAFRNIPDNYQGAREPQRRVED